MPRSFPSGPVGGTGPVGETKNYLAENVVMKKLAFLQPSFIRWAFQASVLACVAVSAGGGAGAAAIQAPSEIVFEFGQMAQPKGGELLLQGMDATRQLLVAAKLSGGRVRDVTRSTRYSVHPAGVVKVDETGRVSVAGDGNATVTAYHEESGLKTELRVRVLDASKTAPVSFANRVVPIFTKASCNSGGCHGKSGGQNGFRLSLLGFEPEEDYEHLVMEARGRRLFPASPENSLLLTKGIGVSPHGGGKRLSRDSDDYRVLLRWIEQGMPYGTGSDPKLEAIEVIPSARIMPLKGSQQIAVLARYSDGSVEDVTRSALYEPNEKSMATVDEEGHVVVSDLPGDVAVMVRYQGLASVFRATVPLGAPVESLPQPRNAIDRAVFAKLRAMGVPASEGCDDATFLRRVSVDIAGRLPTAAEAREFLADKNPSKRDVLIDRLLESDEHAEYFAGKWSALLRNKRSKAQDAPMNFAFHGWLVDAFKANKPYDQIVREVLASSGSPAENPPVAWYFQVKEPQQQLEDTAQLFLGTRLQCAQCHHHPFEKWSQNDYYQFAAFFSTIGRRAPDLVMHKRGVATAVNKKNKLQVKPAALGSGEMKIAPEEDPRLVLADWMRSPENPFFAKTLVNRYWKHFFNRALVEPEDDIRDTNPPSNPELMDVLARMFVESGFDQRSLIREITRSVTYQLSAVPNQYNASDRQSFSRYYPKRMPAEVLYDGISQVTRVGGAFTGLPAGTRAISLPDNSFNSTSYFLTVFGRPESSSACECERTQDASLAQALHLINAKDIQTRLADEKGAAAQLAAHPKGDEQALEELYLSALARQPTADETQLALKHITKPRPSEDGQPPSIPTVKRQAYEDLLWTLINTKEFLFNH